MNLTLYFPHNLLFSSFWRKVWWKVIFNQNWYLVTFCNWNENVQTSPQMFHYKTILIGCKNNMHPQNHHQSNSCIYVELYILHMVVTAHHWQNHRKWDLCMFYYYSSPIQGTRFLSSSGTFSSLDCHLNIFQQNYRLT